MTPQHQMPATADVQRLIATELSRSSKPGHTALLLAGLTAAGLCGALVVTEPALPTRTWVALLVMVATGLSWTVFAILVLARRRVLLGRHRIVAARMAVGFTALYTLGTFALGQWGATGRTWIAATGVGIALFTIAILQLLRARRHIEALQQRRQELERQLSGEGVGR